MMGRLEQLCVARGLRLNDKRRLIMEILESASDHPCVEDVYKRVTARDRNVSMATVYRTMNVLVDAGFLSRLELGDGKMRFEEASGDHHEHLVNVESGEVVEFREPRIEALVRSAAEKLGYHLVGYRLELFAEDSHGQARQRSQDTALDGARPGHRRRRKGRIPLGLPQ